MSDHLQEALQGLIKTQKTEKQTINGKKSILLNIEADKFMRLKLSSVNKGQTMTAIIKDLIDVYLNSLTDEQNN